MNIIDKIYYAGNLCFTSRLKGNYFFYKWKVLFFIVVNLFDVWTNNDCRSTYLIRTNTLICWSFFFDIFKSRFYFLIYYLYTINSLIPLFRSRYVRFLCFCDSSNHVRTKWKQSLKQHSWRTVFKCRAAFLAHARYSSNNTVIYKVIRNVCP